MIEIRDNDLVGDAAFVKLRRSLTYTRTGVTL
jgi:hypothetical protein